MVTSCGFDPHSRYSKLRKTGAFSYTYCLNHTNTIFEPAENLSANFQQIYAEIPKNLSRIPELHIREDPKWAVSAFSVRDIQITYRQFPAFYARLITNTTERVIF